MLKMQATKAAPIVQRRVSWLQASDALE